MLNRQNDNRKYAIYSRKSRFTGKGESIENQIEMCRQYIRMHDLNVTDADMVVFEDEGFSGGNTDRPQFQEMMREIRANRIKVVVCYRLDRISRNVGDFALMYKEFENMSVSFISISENYDTNTPSGRAMLSMCTVFAQMERETIAERIRDNMHELAKTGRWLGGITPTGYKSSQIVGSITVDGKVRKAYKLDIIPEESETVKTIFSQFLSTGSLTKTETYLIQNGIKTKNDKRYTRFSIKSILHNPVYMKADNNAWEYFNDLVEIYADKELFDGKHGVMAYNKTIQKQGKANQVRGYAEWIVTVGKHRPIISSEDWIKSQKLLSQNSLKSYRKPKSNVALLSGLLFCADCGSFMRPKLSKRFNSDGEQIYSYLCELKEKSRMHNCTMKNPNGNELDKAVCNEIRKLSENNQDFLDRLDKAKKGIIVDLKEYEIQKKSITKSLSENKKQIEALITALAKSDGTPAYDYINTKITELHNRNAELTSQLKRNESMKIRSELSNEDISALVSMLSNFSSSFDNMATDEKQRSLRVLIKQIKWDGENAHVYILGDENDVDLTGINDEPQGEDCK